MPGSVDSADEYLERLQEIFPNANCRNAPFYISMELDSFDRTLSYSDSITIFCKYNCGCFRGARQRPINEGFIVTKKPCQNSITVKDAVQIFYTHNYKAKCDHCYLEGFHQITMNEFIAEFGS